MTDAERTTRLESTPSQVPRTSQSGSHCHSCSRAVHSFDLLCPSCGSILVDNPTPEQLEQAERVANIRATLRSYSAWQGVIRPLVPVLATLVVAIGGWVITSAYNRAQLELQSETHESELELQRAEQLASRKTAEANASMAYVQFLSRDPAPSDVQRDLATLSMAPILPPELSFALAVERLPTEERILGVLVRTYSGEVWQYLAAHVESGTQAEPVFQFLQAQDQLTELFDYLLSPANKRTHRRLDALLTYFEFTTKGDPDRGADDLVARICADESVGPLVKSDLTVALALSFPDYNTVNTDFEVYPLAAQYFWSATNVLTGTLPNRHRSRLFAERFHYRHHVDDSRVPHDRFASIVSAGLRAQLTSDQLHNVPVKTIHTILYNYAMGTEGLRYLLPTDVLGVTREILSSLDTAERMQRFSQVLGSMSGDILFRESLGDDREVRRQYAETLLSWYESHAANEWYIPKFLHSVESDFPEYKDRIQAVFNRV